MSQTNVDLVSYLTNKHQDTSSLGENWKHVSPSVALSEVHMNHPELFKDFLENVYNPALASAKVDAGSDPYVARLRQYAEYLEDELARADADKEPEPLTETEFAKLKADDPIRAVYGLRYVKDVLNNAQKAYNLAFNDTDKANLELYVQSIIRKVLPNYKLNNFHIERKVDNFEDLVQVITEEIKRIVVDELSLNDKANLAQQIAHLVEKEHEKNATISKLQDDLQQAWKLIEELKEKKAANPSIVVDPDSDKALVISNAWQTALTTYAGHDYKTGIEELNNNRPEKFGLTEDDALLINSTYTQLDDLITKGNQLVTSTASILNNYIELESTLNELQRIDTVLIEVFNVIFYHTPQLKTVEESARVGMDLLRSLDYGKVPPASNNAPPVGVSDKLHQFRSNIDSLDKAVNLPEYHNLVRDLKDTFGDFGMNGDDYNLLVDRTEYWMKRLAEAKSMSSRDEPNVDFARLEFLANEAAKAGYMMKEAYDALLGRGADEHLSGNERGEHAMGLVRAIQPVHQKDIDGKDPFHISFLRASEPRVAPPGTAPITPDPDTYVVMPKSGPSSAPAVLPKVEPKPVTAAPASAVAVSPEPLVVNPEPEPKPEPPKPRLSFSIMDESVDIAADGRPLPRHVDLSISDVNEIVDEAADKYGYNEYTQTIIEILEHAYEELSKEKADFKAEIEAKNQTIEDHIAKYEHLEKKYNKLLADIDQYKNTVSALETATKEHKETESNLTKQTEELKAKVKNVKKYVSNAWSKYVEIAFSNKAANMAFGRNLFQAHDLTALNDIRELYMYLSNEKVVDKASVLYNLIKLCAIPEFNVNDEKILPGVFRTNRLNNWQVDPERNDVVTENESNVLRWLCNITLSSFVKAFNEFGIPNPNNSIDGDSLYNDVVEISNRFFDIIIMLNFGRYEVSEDDLRKVFTDEFVDLYLQIYTPNSGENGGFTHEIITEVENYKDYLNRPIATLSNSMVIDILEARHIYNIIRYVFSKENRDLFIACGNLYDLLKRNKLDYKSLDIKQKLIISNFKEEIDNINIEYVNANTTKLQLKNQQQAITNLYQQQFNAKHTFKEDKNFISDTLGVDELPFTRPVINKIFGITDNNTVPQLSAVARFINKYITNGDVLIDKIIDLGTTLTDHQLDSKDTLHKAVQNALSRASTNISSSQFTDSDDGDWTVPYSIELIFNTCKTIFESKQYDEVMKLMGKDADESDASVAKRGFIKCYFGSYRVLIQLLRYITFVKSAKFNERIISISSALKALIPNNNIVNILTPLLINISDNEFEEFSPKYAFSVVAFNLIASCTNKLLNEEITVNTDILATPRHPQIQFKGGSIKMDASYIHGIWLWWDSLVSVGSPTSFNALFNRELPTNIGVERLRMIVNQSQDGEYKNKLNQILDIYSRTLSVDNVITPLQNAIDYVLKYVNIINLLLPTSISSADATQAAENEKVAKSYFYNSSDSFDATYALIMTGAQNAVNGQMYGAVNMHGAVLQNADEISLVAEVCRYVLREACEIILNPDKPNIYTFIKNNDSLKGQNKPYDDMFNNLCDWSNVAQTVKKNRWRTQVTKEEVILFNDLVLDVARIYNVILDQEDELQRDNADFSEGYDIFTACVKYIDSLTTQPGQSAIQRAGQGANRIVNIVGNFNGHQNNAPFNLTTVSAFNILKRMIVYNDEKSGQECVISQIKHKMLAREKLYSKMRLVASTMMSQTLDTILKALEVIITTLDPQLFRLLKDGSRTVLNELVYIVPGQRAGARNQTIDSRVDDICQSIATNIQNNPRNAQFLPTRNPDQITLIPYVLYTYHFAPYTFNKFNSRIRNEALETTWINDIFRKLNVNRQYDEKVPCEVFSKLMLLFMNIRQGFCHVSDAEEIRGTNAIYSSAPVYSYACVQNTLNQKTIVLYAMLWSVRSQMFEFDRVRAGKKPADLVKEQRTVLTELLNEVQTYKHSEVFVNDSLLNKIKAPFFKNEKGNIVLDLDGNLAGAEAWDEYKDANGNPVKYLRNERDIARILNKLTAALKIMISVRETKTELAKMYKSSGFFGDTSKYNVKACLNCYPYMISLSTYAFAHPKSILGDKASDAECKELKISICKGMLEMYELITVNAVKKPELFKFYCELGAKILDRAKKEPITDDSFMFSTSGPGMMALRGTGDFSGRLTDMDECPKIEFKEMFQDGELTGESVKMLTINHAFNDKGEMQKHLNQYDKDMYVQLVSLVSRLIYYIYAYKKPEISEIPAAEPFFGSNAKDLHIADQFTVPEFVIKVCEYLREYIKFIFTLATHPDFIQILDPNTEKMSPSFIQKIWLLTLSTLQDEIIQGNLQGIIDYFVLPVEMDKQKAAQGVQQIISEWDDLANVPNIVGPDGCALLIGTLLLAVDYDFDQMYQHIQKINNASEDTINQLFTAFAQTVYDPAAQPNGGTFGSVMLQAFNNMIAKVINIPWHDYDTHAREMAGLRIAEQVTVVDNVYEGIYSSCLMPALVDHLRKITSYASEEDTDNAGLAADFVEFTNAARNVLKTKINDFKRIKKTRKDIYNNIKGWNDYKAQHPNFAVSAFSELRADYWKQKAKETDAAMEEYDRVRKRIQRMLPKTGKMNPVIAFVADLDGNDTEIFQKVNSLEIVIHERLKQIINALPQPGIKLKQIIEDENELMDADNDIPILFMQLLKAYVSSITGLFNVNGTINYPFAFTVLIPYTYEYIFDSMTEVVRNDRNVSQIVSWAARSNFIHIQQGQPVSPRDIYIAVYRHLVLNHPEFDDQNEDAICEYNDYRFNRYLVVDPVVPVEQDLSFPAIQIQKNPLAINIHKLDPTPSAQEMARRARLTANYQNEVAVRDRILQFAQQGYKALYDNVVATYNKEFKELKCLEQDLIVSTEGVLLGTLYEHMLYDVYNNCPLISQNEKLVVKQIVDEIDQTRNNMHLCLKAIAKLEKKRIKGKAVDANNLQQLKTQYDQLKADLNNLVNEFVNGRQDQQIGVFAKLLSPQDLADAIQPNQIQDYSQPVDVFDVQSMNQKYQNLAVSFKALIDYGEGFVGAVLKSTKSSIDELVDEYTDHVDDVEKKSNTITTQLDMVIRSLETQLQQQTQNINLRQVPNITQADIQPITSAINDLKAKRTMAEQSAFRMLHEVRDKIDEDIRTVINTAAHIRSDYQLQNPTRGVPHERIAYYQQPENAQEKQAVFADMNNRKPVDILGEYDRRIKQVDDIITKFNTSHNNVVASANTAIGRGVFIDAGLEKIRQSCIDYMNSIVKDKTDNQRSLSTIAPILNRRSIRTESLSATIAIDDLAVFGCNTLVQIIKNHLIHNNDHILMSCFYFYKGYYYTTQPLFNSIIYIVDYCKANIYQNNDAYKADNPAFMNIAIVGNNIAQPPPPPPVAAAPPVNPVNNNVPPPVAAAPPVNPVNNNVPPPPPNANEMPNPKLTPYIVGFNPAHFIHELFGYTMKPRYINVIANALAEIGGGEEIKNVIDTILTDAIVVSDRSKIRVFNTVVQVSNMISNQIKTVFDQINLPQVILSRKNKIEQDAQQNNAQVNPAKALSECAWVVVVIVSLILKRINLVIDEINSMFTQDKSWEKFRANQYLKCMYAFANLINHVVVKITNLYTQMTKIQNKDIEEDALMFGCAQSLIILVPFNVVLVSHAVKITSPDVSGNIDQIGSQRVAEAIKTLRDDLNDPLSNVVETCSNLYKYCNSHISFLKNDILRCDRTNFLLNLPNTFVKELDNLVTDANDSMKQLMIDITQDQDYDINTQFKGGLTKNQYLIKYLYDPANVNETGWVYCAVFARYDLTQVNAPKLSEIISSLSTSKQGTPTGNAHLMLEDSMQDFLNPPNNRPLPIHVPLGIIPVALNNPKVQPEPVLYANETVEEFEEARNKYWLNKPQPRVQGGLLRGGATDEEEALIRSMLEGNINTLVILYNDCFATKQRAAIKYENKEKLTSISLVLKILFWIVAIFLIGLIVYVVVKIIRIERSSKAKAKALQPKIIKLKKKTSKYL